MYSRGIIPFAPARLILSAPHMYLHTQQCATVAPNSQDHKVERQLKQPTDEWTKGRTVWLSIWLRHRSLSEIVDWARAKTAMTPEKPKSSEHKTIANARWLLRVHKAEGDQLEAVFKNKFQALDKLTAHHSSSLSAFHTEIKSKPAKSKKAKDLAHGHFFNSEVNLNTAKSKDTDVMSPDHFSAMLQDEEIELGLDLKQIRMAAKFTKAKVNLSKKKSIEADVVSPDQFMAMLHDNEMEYGPDLKQARTTSKSVEAQVRPNETKSKEADVVSPDQFMAMLQHEEIGLGPNLKHRRLASEYLKPKVEPNRRKSRAANVFWSDQFMAMLRDEPNTAKIKKTAAISPKPFTATLQDEPNTVKNEEAVVISPKPLMAMLQNKAPKMGLELKQTPLASSGVRGRRRSPRRFRRKTSGERKPEMEKIEQLSDKLPAQEVNFDESVKDVPAEAAEDATSQPLLQKMTLVSEAHNHEIVTSQPNRGDDPVHKLIPEEQTIVVELAPSPESVQIHEKQSSAENAEAPAEQRAKVSATD